MRRAAQIQIALGAALTAMLIGGCGASGHTSHSSDPPAPAIAQVVSKTARLPAARVDLTARNRAAAIRDAKWQLAGLRLPPGAVRVASKPAGGHGYLNARSLTERKLAQVTRVAWWVVPEAASGVITYIGTHPPHRDVANMHGTGSDSKTGSSMVSIGFPWPPVGRVLNYRNLVVTATALPDGRTGVLAQATSDWIVPRPGYETVPRGVTTVTVVFKRAATKLGAKHAGRTSTVRITTPAKVQRAIRLVDGLETLQGGAMFCTLEGGPTGYLDVRYSAGPAGPALAEARVTLFAGWGLGGGANACDAIAFTVNGHAERDLVGASFVKQMVALAGLRL